jgi:hypothetical protein
MKSDKKFDDTISNTSSLPTLVGGRLQKNSVIGRSGQTLQRLDVHEKLHSSSTVKLLQLTTRNGTSQNPRRMAWDNQRIFGPAPENQPSFENGNLEGE